MSINVFLNGTPTPVRVCSGVFLNVRKMSYSIKCRSGQVSLFLPLNLTITPVQRHHFFFHLPKIELIQEVMCRSGKPVFVLLCIKETVRIIDNLILLTIIKEIHLFKYNTTKILNIMEASISSEKCVFFIILQIFFTEKQSVILTLNLVLN